MKGLVLFPLLVLTYLAAAQNCVEYICNPPGMLWADWICGMEKPFNSSQFALKVDACESDEYCSLSNWNGSPATCQPYNNQSQNDAYPGEPCNSEHECSNGSCVNNTCSAQPKLASCNYQGCGIGLTCLDGVCYPLSKVGGQCTQDSDCVVNAGCDISSNAPSGVCVEYLSLPPKSPVQSCGWGNSLSTNLLCESTLCYSTNYNGPYFCAGTVTSTSPLPVSNGGYNNCQSTVDSVSGYSMQSNSGCGYDGFDYCGLFPGDAPMQAYLSDVRAYLNSTAIHKCSTLRRPGNNYQESFMNYVTDWCAQATYKITRTMAYNYYYAVKYQAVVNAERCVLKILQPAFYNTTRHSAGGFLPEPEDQ